MLIDLPAKINFGDIIIDSQGRYFLVIKNTYDSHFNVLLVNLQSNRVEDEFYDIAYISQAVHVIGVISGEEIELRRRVNDKG